ncbi:helix-turn-helix domain-containing protein [Saccharothrix yanglingensis]|uniref:PucR family transcriptional regulator n=1 Tax=Saccharothrix yanglingensis TaxID=659496 RepID=A0ABU0X467_9PSEU|nr:helix-turn-helix domain-containing protein [Saccharothrix yanglingensis]MDQ2586925.1 PucR family transcriptional regulator [Saccharothrix yanglingensis]
MPSRPTRTNTSRHTEDDHLRLLCQEATGPDGVRRVLELLARRFTGEVVLTGPGEGQAVAVPSDTGRLLRLVGGELAEDVARVRAGHVDAAAVHAGGHDIAVLPVGPPPARPVLVVARRGPLTAEHRRFLAAAVNPLWLCWRTAVAEQRAERLDAADATVREAVLHLLMVGDVSGARRTAAVLRPELPDLARVYVIENAPDSRARLSPRCRDVFGEAAWVVPCPVYSGHVIVIAPAGGDERRPAPATRLIRELVETVPGTRMGIGLPVALRDIPIGYKQAFHALSVARHRSERYARFSPRGELGELLGHAGRAWAAGTLAPLLAYRPARPRDPDAFELLATLLSWLEFGARAASQLKIHRNTLASRLHRVGAELDRDLTRFAVQSELHLALQLIDERPHPGAAAGAIGIDELFDRPEVRRWAETLLSPLPDATRRTLLTTVRTWFRHDLRTTAAAADLGISAHGLRKRLARVEELLGRALLVGPSARYDLHHALRVHVEPARA